VCQYISINLFIAVLLENFNIVQSEDEQGSAKIDFGDQMETFVNLWAVYDPDATHFISIKQLGHLMFALDPPLGLGKNASEKDLRAFYWETEIPIYVFPKEQLRKVRRRASEPFEHPHRATTRLI